MAGLRPQAGCPLDQWTVWRSSRQPEPLPHPLVELHFSLMEKLDNDRKLLSVHMRRPATLAANDEKIALTLVFYAALNVTVAH
jgi:hypothetical protein